MTDRELFEMALDMIFAAIKSGDWKVDGACDPDIVIEALRARLAEPPKDLELPLVRPEEFVKLIEGKENFWGIPVIRTEWPTRREQ